jgi:hypothetical protein
MTGWRLSLGTLAAVLSSAAVTDIAWAACGRWFETSRLARLAGTVTLATAAVVVLLEVLGTLSLLNTWLAPAVTVLAWVATRAGRLGGGGERRLRLAARPLPGDRLTFTAWAVVLATGSLVLVALAYSISQPRPLHDVLSGHLPVAVQWLQAGNTRLLPYVSPVSPEAHYPANTELLGLWLLLPVHRDFLVQLASAPGVLLLILSTALLARELGARRLPAAGAALLVPTLPLCLNELVGTNMTDMLATGGVVAAAAFSCRAWRTRSRPDLLVTGLAAGLAAGSRYGSVPALLPVAGILVLAVTRGRERARSALRLGWAAAGALLTGGYFYVRNALLTGDPIYPQPVPWHPRLPPEMVAFPAFRSYISAGWQPGGWWLAVEQGLAVGGPVFLLLAALVALPPLVAVVGRRTDLRGWLFALLPAVQLLVFLALPLSAGFVVNGLLQRHGVTLNLRYALPALALCAALLAVLLSRLPGPWQAGAVIGSGLVALGTAGVDFVPHVPRSALAMGALAGVAIGITTLYPPAPVRGRRGRGVMSAALAAVSVAVAALAPLDARHFDATRARAGMVFNDAAALVPERGRVAVAGFCQTYALYGPRLDREVEYLTGDDARVDRPIAGDRQRWLAALRDRRVDWLVVGSDICFLDQPVPQRDWVAAEPRRFHPVASTRGWTVYRVQPVTPEPAG